MEGNQGGVASHVDWDDVAATCHVVAATSALLIGAVVVFRRKGTQSHRLVGGAYVVTLVLVDITALLVHHEATFGVFHVLAIVSLITVAVGVVPLLLGRRSPEVFAMHAYCMVWTYAGLVAAGCGQLAASAAEDSSRAVLGAIGFVLLVAALLIVWRVPPALRGVLD